MRITVLGLGNVLMGDDAFGPWVVQLLRAGWLTPPNVRVIDGGAPGLDLIPHLTATDALIVVDTVRDSGPPGSLRLVTKDELLQNRPSSERVSPSVPDLEDVLLTLRLHGEASAHILLVGAVPARTDAGIGMSDELLDAVPAGVAMVVDEIDRLGYHARARAVPAPMDPWWHRQYPAEDPDCRGFPHTP